MLETLNQNPLFNDKCIKLLEDHVYPVWNNRKFKEVKNTFVEHKLEASEKIAYNSAEDLLREFVHNK